MRLMAISGSARQASTKTSLLRALSAAAPFGMKIKLFAKIGTLPVFSPDHEGAKTPESVRAFISEIEASDGLIIASPEYVRAIPGGLKNAIDWLVSGESIVNKPVALVHASHRGDDMLASLRIVLVTVSTQFTEYIFLRFPLMSKTPNEIRAFVQQHENKVAAVSFLNAFATFIKSPRA